MTPPSAKLAAVHPVVASVTAAIARRSQPRRGLYLSTLAMQRTHRAERLARRRLSAANLAHGYAALPRGDKLRVVSEPVPMIGIVSAYNDVLSAHQPLADYPAIVKALTSLGYDGYLGMEYLPAGDAYQSLTDAIALFRSYA